MRSALLPCSVAHTIRDSKPPPREFTEGATTPPSNCDVLISCITNSKKLSLIQNDRRTFRFPLHTFSARVPVPLATSVEADGFFFIFLFTIHRSPSLPWTPSPRTHGSLSLHERFSLRESLAFPQVLATCAILFFFHVPLHASAPDDCWVNPLLAPISSTI